MRYFIALLMLVLGPASVYAAPGLAADWVLRGTLVMDEPHGVAIIEMVATGEQQAVKVGADLVAGIELVEVHYDHAIVQAGSNSYRLNYGDQIGGYQPVGIEYAVSWSDLPDLLEQLEVIPHQQEGRVVGYFINNIHGGIGDKLGLKPGDILLSVNGVHLDHDLNSEVLYQELKESSLSLQLKRDGHELQLSYQISL